MEKKRRGRPRKEESREKRIQVRLSDAEANELDEAIKLTELKKSDLVKEAVKLYLNNLNIHIWN